MRFWLLSVMLLSLVASAGTLNVNKLDLSQKELQLFIKAYMLGREDAERDFHFFNKKTLSYLKDVYVTKKLIKEGDLRIVIKSQVQPVGGNQFRVVKVFTFEVISPEELMKDKAFLKRIEEKGKVLDNYSGWWVYLKIENVPAPMQGLIEYALLKEGLKPQRLGTVLVAGIFSRKADAQMWKKLLKEKYNLDFAVAEVRDGKTLDPLVEAVLNSLE